MFIKVLKKLFPPAMTQCCFELEDCSGVKVPAVALTGRSRELWALEEVLLTWRGQNLSALISSVSLLSFSRAGAGWSQKAVFSEAVVPCFTNLTARRHCWRAQEAARVARCWLMW